MDIKLMKSLAMSDIGLTEDEAERAVNDFIETNEEELRASIAQHND